MTAHQFRLLLSAVHRHHSKPRVCDLKQRHFLFETNGLLSLSPGLSRIPEIFFVFVDHKRTTVQTKTLFRGESGYIAFMVLRSSERRDEDRGTTLVRRGKRWFRYDAPDKKLFKAFAERLTARS